MRYIITLMLLLLMTGTVFAHGGTDDIAEHQAMIAGVGIIAILLAGIYSLTGERADDDEIFGDDTET